MLIYKVLRIIAGGKDRPRSPVHDKKLREIRVLETFQPLRVTCTALRSGAPRPAKRREERLRQKEKYLPPIYICVFVFPSVFNILPQFCASVADRGSDLAGNLHSQASLMD